LGGRGRSPTFPAGYPDSGPVGGKETMRKNVRVAQFALGMEGLGLLRQWLVGEEKDIEDRIRRICGMCERLDEPPLSEVLEVSELGVGEAYADWSKTYDTAPNPLIDIEESYVYAVLDGIEPGNALDAACGTGRHARYLRERGHMVVGVDGSPEMLDKARARVPGADFRVGDLSDLPLQDASVDLAVCSLALTHLPNLGPPIRELARVVRAGGRIVLSDIHPIYVALGGQALFQKTDGRLGFARNYYHPHSVYLESFEAAGLRLRRCQEPLLTDAETAALDRPSLIPEGARGSAMVGLPSLLIWELEPPG